MQLGERFDEALAWASDIHRAQERKGTEIPYASHLLTVTALVLEDGGDEDQAIAALLHDACEDQGVPIEDVQRRFGDRVAKIVAACTDSFEDPKPPWKERKAAYIDRVRESHDDDALRVSLADKLHNSRAILRDLTFAGPPGSVWGRFDQGRDCVLWYYRSLVDAFRARTGGPLLEELDAGGHRARDPGGRPLARLRGLTRRNCGPERARTRPDLSRSAARGAASR